MEDSSGSVKQKVELPNGDSANGRKGGKNCTCHKIRNGEKLAIIQERVSKDIE